MKKLLALAILFTFASPAFSQDLAMAAREINEKWSKAQHPTDAPWILSRPDPEKERLERRVAELEAKIDELIKAVNHKNGYSAPPQAPAPSYSYGAPIYSYAPTSFGQCVGGN